MYVCMYVCMYVKSFTGSLLSMLNEFKLFKSGFTHSYAYSCHVCPEFQNNATALHVCASKCTRSNILIHF